MEYNRIIYPERAEYLSEQKFRSYKVFLSHWDALSAKKSRETMRKRISGVSARH
jgi:hypothetical protein